MNSLTDGSYLGNLTDSDLAFWLVNDAQKVDGHPGMNNVASSLRQAAFRLDPESTPWLSNQSVD